MPTNPTIIFDIETGPLPASELVIPPFDPSLVKLGNIKNPDLIAERIQKAEENHITDYIKNAALDAVSGQVLCIAYKVPGDKARVLCADADGEKAMLIQFWDILCGFERQPRLVGFNTRLFDLPFLYKRSWKHGITPPYWLRHGRYWNDLIVDLHDLWQLGDSRAHGSRSRRACPSAPGSSSDASRVSGGSRSSRCQSKRKPSAPAPMRPATSNSARPDATH